MTRSNRTMNCTPAMNGVAATTSSEVDMFAQTSSGMRQKFIPGARMVTIVTRQFRAVELGAHDHRDQPADEKEEEARADVLDPDDLVVGVELEVVPPRAGAVLGVVLRDGRRADRPPQPVVEGADPGEEAERAGDGGDD